MNKITREWTTEFTPEMLEELKRSWDKANGPDMSRAYLVVPPAVFEDLKMSVETLSCPDYNFKYLNSFNLYGIPVLRMPSFPFYFADCSVNPKPIVWRDEIKPTKPTKSELGIIIASLALILFLSCSVFN